MPIGGGDYTTQKSTTGYIFFLGEKAPISWRSILQKSVALSSCEAEYMALKETFKECIFLKDLYKQLGIKSGKNLVLTDSKSAIELANNPEHHSRTKHIDIQEHFVRECVLNKSIALEYISTKEQVADILTKGLDSNNYKRLRDYIL